VSCDHCRIAPEPTYQWGPVNLPLEEIRRKLALSRQALKAWNRLTDIRITERTEHGRPLEITLVSNSGKKSEWLAERFRLALAPTRIRSTAFDLKIVDDMAVFENGKGFGHGVGLCQWGLEGQARKGVPAGTILRNYYPGSQLTRVY
jgi:stage II sporulation protein D